MLNVKPFKEVRAQTRATLPDYPKNWKPVKEFPNLTGASFLALDPETKDPELLEAGPGWARGVGHLIGVSVATKDAAWYFPMRHEVQPELNMDPDKVLAWCKDNFVTDIPKVFANAQYDVGWLAQEGITVNGKCYDVQTAERLLDETKFNYSLEAIATQYVGEGKVSNELYEWLARAYGGKPDGKQRANMYRSPPSLAGPYAEGDARLPFDIFRKQWKLLKVARLLEVFDIETRLIPLLVKMRMRGVNISEEKAIIARQGLQQEIKQLQQSLNEEAGFTVNVSSSHDLQRLFKKEKIEIEYTAKGNPSFQAVWLENCPSLSASKIVNIRKYKKVISTFIEGAILNKHINGRVYTSFRPLGAITGRFSSANPNLQNIPSRDKKLGPLVRAMFIPDEGYPSWIKMDYSSVEFRVFAHFIQDLTLLEAYNNNPLTDFHKVVEDMVGGGLPRVAYKTLSFSRMYGGGVNTITTQMAHNFVREQLVELIKKFGAPVLSNPPEQLARLIMNLYDEKFPAVDTALKNASTIAQETGEMRTLLGRRVTYNKWEPIRGRNTIGLPYSSAASKWGRNNIRRAKTYKALNVYNQGTSADIMKAAMVAAYESGLFDDDKLGPPHLTVHDELDESYHPDLHKYFLELKVMMEETTKLSVPLIVEADLGPDWGSVKKFKL